MLLEQLIDAVPPVKGPRGRPGRPRKRPAKLHLERATTTRAAGGRCGGGGSARGSPVASRKLVSQLSVVGVPYATWSSFPVVGIGLVVSSVIEASLR
jgi:hypothetical protein